MASRSILDFIIEISILSGGLIPLMALVFVIALALCIERWWFFRKNIKAGLAMEHDLQLVKYQDENAFNAVAKHYDGSLQANIIATALACRGEDEQTMERHIDEAIMWNMPKMDRNIWWVDTSVTLAPLMGLFGTIIGMIESFSVLGQAGSGNPDAVTGGVAHALVATALGLFIAMICLVFLNFFNRRNRLALHQMELLKQMVINRLHGGGSTYHGQPLDAATTGRAATIQPKLADAK